MCPAGSRTPGRSCRDATPSLRNTAPRWCLTVLTETTSSAAISGLVIPCAGQPRDAQLARGQRLDAVGPGTTRSRAGDVQLAADLRDQTAGAAAHREVRRLAQRLARLEHPPGPAQRRAQGPQRLGELEHRRRLTQHADGLGQQLEPLLPTDEHALRRAARPPIRAPARPGGRARALADEQLRGLRRRHLGNASGRITRRQGQGKVRAPRLHDRVEPPICVRIPSTRPQVRGRPGDIPAQQRHVAPRPQKRARPGRVHGQRQLGHEVRAPRPPPRARRGARAPRPGTRTRTASRRSAHACRARSKRAEQDVARAREVAAPQGDQAAVRVGGDRAEHQPVPCRVLGHRVRQKPTAWSSASTNTSASTACTASHRVGGVLSAAAGRRRARRRRAAGTSSQRSPRNAEHEREQQPQRTAPLPRPRPAPRAGAPPGCRAAIGALEQAQGDPQIERGTDLAPTSARVPELSAQRCGQRPAPPGMPPRRSSRRSGRPRPGRACTGSPAQLKRLTQPRHAVGDRASSSARPSSCVTTAPLAGHRRLGERPLQVHDRARRARPGAAPPHPAARSRGDRRLDRRRDRCAADAQRPPRDRRPPRPAARPHAREGGRAHREARSSSIAERTSGCTKASGRSGRDQLGGGEDVGRGPRRARRRSRPARPRGAPAPRHRARPGPPRPAPRRRPAGPDARGSSARSWPARGATAAPPRDSRAPSVAQRESAAISSRTAKALPAVASAHSATSPGAGAWPIRSASSAAIASAPSGASDQSSTWGSARISDSGGCALPDRRGANREHNHERGQLRDPRAQEVDEAQRRARPSTARRRAAGRPARAGPGPQRPRPAHRARRRPAAAPRSASPGASTGRGRPRPARPGLVVVRQAQEQLAGAPEGAVAGELAAAHATADSASPACARTLGQARPAARSCPAPGGPSTTIIGPSLLAPRRAPPANPPARRRVPAASGPVSVGQASQNRQRRPRAPGLPRRKPQTLPRPKMGPLGRCRTGGPSVSLLIAPGCACGRGRAPGAHGNTAARRVHARCGTRGSACDHDRPTAHPGGGSDALKDRRIEVRGTIALDGKGPGSGVVGGAAGMRDRRGLRGPGVRTPAPTASPGYHWNHKLPKVAPVVPGKLLKLGDGVYPRVLVDAAGTGQIAWTTAAQRRGVSAARLCADARPDRLRGQLEPAPAHLGRAEVQHRRSGSDPAGDRQRAADAQPPLPQRRRRCPTVRPATRPSCGPRRTAVSRSPGRARSATSRRSGNAVVFGGDQPQIGVITDTMTGGTIFQATPPGAYTSQRLNLGDQGPDEAYNGRLAVDGTNPVAAFTDLSNHIFIREYSGSGNIYDSANWSVEADRRSGLHAPGRRPERRLAAVSENVLRAAVPAADRPRRPHRRAQPGHAQQRLQPRLLRDHRGRERADHRRLLRQQHCSWSSAARPMAATGRRRRRSPRIWTAQSELSLGAAQDGGGFAAFNEPEPGGVSHYQVAVAAFGSFVATGLKGLGNLDGAGLGGLGGDPLASTSCTDVHFGGDRRARRGGLLPARPAQSDQRRRGHPGRDPPQRDGAHPRRRGRDRDRSAQAHDQLDRLGPRRAARPGDRGHHALPRDAQPQPAGFAGRRRRDVRRLGHGDRIDAEGLPVLRRASTSS